MVCAKTCAGNSEAEEYVAQLHERPDYMCTLLGHPLCRTGDQARDSLKPEQIPYISRTNCVPNHLTTILLTLL